jgi:hypothetical protein
MNEKQFVGIHLSHCCLKHGCKYGDGDDCPVESGEMTQEYRCEQCYQDDSNETRQEAIKSALSIIELYGQIDGPHHKAWVIDQVARALLKDDYPSWVVGRKDGKDGPNTYGYDPGIAP